MNTNPKGALLAPDLALRKILEHVPDLPPEKVFTLKSVGRILSQEIRAKDDLPPFDNSAMDGYAVRTADLEGAGKDHPVVLRVRGTVRAGSLPENGLGRGEAVRIMTGSPLPKAADAVVMKEWTRSDGNGTVEIYRQPKKGDHIRPRGEDVSSGDLLLEPGTLLRPYEVALLASQGILRVSVVKRPRVSILATGDELLPFTSKLSPGKIRNSSGPALLSALARWGAEARDLGVIRDDPKNLERDFLTALKGSDMVLATGGVSVGDFDFTRSTLLKIGVEEIFWKVAIKPGKPLFFGIRHFRSANVPVFGLPGNAISSLVCLEEFVRPALEKLQGHSPGHPSYHLKGKAVNEYPKPMDRQQYLFCRATTGVSGFSIQIIRPQGSAMLGMACKANALAVAPVGVSLISPGDILPFRWLK